MRRLARIILALSAVVVGASVCRAQSISPTQPTPTEKPGKARVNRLENKLTVEADLLSRDGKSIKVTFDSPTSGVTKPGMVNLEFYGFWKGFGKPTNRQTEIVWGAGERFVGEADFLHKPCQSSDGSGCYQILFSLPVAYETIEKIANSENVIVTFGEVAVRLTSEEIREFRDLGKSFVKR